jgi:hypothetical protein
MKRVLDKKGSVDVTFPVVIFLVVNIAFALTLLAFVNKTLSGAAIYEEIYAKKVGLMIDEAIPTTKIILDVSKAIEIAKKNGIVDELKLKNELIQFDKENHLVVVKLGNIESYKFPYFSNCSLSDPIINNNQLVFEVKNG